MTRARLRDEIIALLGFLAAPPVDGVGEPAAPTGLRPRSLLSALTGALAGDYGDARNGDARNGGRGGEAGGSRGEVPRG